MLDNNKIDNDVKKDSNQTEQVNVREKEKGKGTFYGIIAFAVFIIMAVGATFAYFTASTNSVSGSVRTGSTTLKLDFISYESAWISQNLIPAATNVVEYSVEKRPDDNSGKPMCIDDYGNEICSLYVFQVRNNANSPQDVFVSLQSEENNFENLTAMLYRVHYKDENAASASAPSFSPDPIFVSSENSDGEVAEGEEPDPCIGENNSCVQVKDGGGGDLYPKGDARYSDPTVPDVGFVPVYVNRLNVVKELQSVTTTETTGEEGSQTTTTTTTPSIAVKVPAVGEPAVRLSDAVTLHGLGEANESNYETFMIVLYIKETGDSQNGRDDQSTFSGTVIVSGGDGTVGVTGTIGGVDKDDFTGLQSDTNTNTTQSGEPETEPATTTEP